MTELLARAFEEASRLPQEVQDELAQRVLAELRPIGELEGKTHGQIAGEAVVPRPALKALVGLLDGPLDVDVYLERTRGPAWDADLDGGA